MKDQSTMRLPAVIFAVLCLIVGTVIAYGIANRTINWLENAQVAELEQSMFAGGIDWVTYQPDGFSMTISGQAPDIKHQERAVQIATMIVGDGLIDLTTAATPATVAPESTVPMVEIMRNGGDISLIGRLPVGEGRAILDRGIATISTATKVVDITEPLETDLPSGWISALGFGAQILLQTDRAIVTVTPGKVVVDTVADSANWQDGLRELLENMRPPDVTLLINIAAPRIVIAPYRFVLDMADPSLAECAAQNEIEARRITTQIQPMTLPGFDCEIGIGAPSYDWGQVVFDTVETLFSFGEGSLLIDDSDITLTVPFGISEQELAIAVNGLRAKLPEVYSLHISVPEPLPTAEEIAGQVMVEFHATLSSEGFVTLTGALKDQLTQDVVVRYAESKFGYNLVDSDFDSQTVLPDGWQKRVFAAIEALSLLESGAFDLTLESLTVSGVASFDSPEVELSELLIAALGKSAVFDLDLTYEPKDEVEEDALDPRVCAARVTTILGDNQISFAPSSAVIEESSKPTIEAITLILANCRSANFEIGGHTDSQGREEMNRSLSQSRADAVLDSMLAQNLLLGPLTAVGYGESEPIADNDTEDGRAANRRIVIKLIRDTDQEAEEDANNE